VKEALARGRLALVEKLTPRAVRTVPFDPLTLLGALPVPTVLLDGENRFRYANQAAEQFLGLSMLQLRQMSLHTLLPADNPLFSLLGVVRTQGVTIADHDLTLESPRLAKRGIAIQAAPLSEDGDCVILTLQDSSAARALDRQMAFRGAARSVSGMSAILAHEVKNPLSGIRGAAQLLEASVADADRELTVLIRDEADRIRALVDRMEVFGEKPIERRAVNIHRVLEHVRRLAQSGVAQGVRITEVYDPSLPPAWGNRDQLVQVVLNLVKNAAEAILGEPSLAERGGGEIVLTTAYQHGVRLAVPATGERQHLPLVVTVRDNGPGIPEDIRGFLFDPFVTSKPSGSGLGLALVAKIIGDHDGLIEVDSRPGRTEFRICLPVLSESEPELF
jgi:two-component system, NtrC family, nitrogen regulation sensor histidine kinase GlnL